MSKALPARRPAMDAQVGDIVQSHNDPAKALWKVERVREAPHARPPRALLHLRSLTSNRRDVRSTTWLDVLSPEEVARIQGKRSTKRVTNDTLVEDLASKFHELLDQESTATHAENRASMAQAARDYLAELEAIGALR